MKGYKASKTASKVSISKTENKYLLIKKNYDSDTGAELDDSTTEYFIESVTGRITDIDAQITALTAEKADYEQLKTDFEAL
jgi:hypothetical protein